MIHLLLKKRKKKNGVSKVPPSSESRTTTDNLRRRLRYSCIRSYERHRLQWQSWNLPYWWERLSHQEDWWEFLPPCPLEELCVVWWLDRWGLRLWPPGFLTLSFGPCRKWRLVGNFVSLTARITRALSHLFQKLSQLSQAYVQLIVSHFSNHKWNAFCECWSP